ncbi:MAG: hypothetical protein WB543_11275, partial [Candidatus Acidiferrum sp.]
QDPADNHDQADQLFKKLNKPQERQRTSHEGQTALRRVYREIFEFPDDDFILRKTALGQRCTRATQQRLDWA